MENKFIVFSGKKQAGKTTAARHIADLLGDAQITSFASPIKEFCINILDIKEEQIYGTDEEKNSPTMYRWENLPLAIKTRYNKKEFKGGPMTAREVMQVFGTDIMRESFDLDIWAKAPFRKKYDTKWVIIDDCRFPNEAVMSLEYGACLVRLDRCRPSEDNHPSEVALDKFDQWSHLIKGDICIDELKHLVTVALIEKGLVSGT